MRTFHLLRLKDESGVSGTGIVAEGIQFCTGRCALAWIMNLHSIAIYECIEDIQAIHGHNGNTIILWAGEEEDAIQTIREWSLRNGQAQGQVDPAQETPNPGEG